LNAKKYQKKWCKTEILGGGNGGSAAISYKKYLEV